MKYQLNNLLPYDGEVYYFPNFLESVESDTLFLSLKNQIQWRQFPIKIFGKMIMQPRLVAWMCDQGLTYTYSHTTLNEEPWLPEVKICKTRIESFLRERNFPAKQSTFNSALINYYRDGNDSMGWHRDNEKELGKNPTIASLNLGNVRKFVLKHYFNKTETIELLLEPGSLLVMMGTTQHFWQHALPKSKTFNKERINITFRQINH